ncbi:DUF924 domain-containing protein [Thalassotalea sp. HSM 43]|uniref:DUF924 family protein n=1 Tax=Thalassotalea sp. HSM 43 TaxID=2552945 RepID=UPI0010815054|nr:DUF924 family protein [Thalassotalea sp. HSM 43]QBY05379.1 DUF924 domain-containing protein [Thalassotalea sp. HSM 43]
MSANIEKVIEFWFGEIKDQLSAAEKQQLWYQSTPQQDEQIRQQFEHLYEQACQGALDAWQRTAKGCMALIILLDQMPRNMYRGSKQAFMSDHVALKVCLHGLEQGFDRELQLVERCFFYHPLEHSEELKHQELCVVEFERLHQVYQGQAQQMFIRNGLDFAMKHRDIIAEFGRFPHRNKVLQRDSSAAELEYLKHGPSFGQ